MAATVRQRTADGRWATPTWHSQAQVEIAATSRLMRTDGTAWGHEPASTVYTAAAMLIAAVLEHVDGVLVSLVVNLASTLVIDTMTRAALEAASQAWWLTDPAIGARARVAHLYVLRRRSAAHLEHTAGKMGVTLTPGMGAQVKDIDFFYRDQLGLAEDLGPKGGWKGSENQELHGSTELAALFMREVGQDPAADPYAFCCGASHAELWRLQYGYTSTTAPDGTETIIARPPRDFVRTAVSVCIDAAIQPTARAFLLLGRGAALADLRRLERPLKNAMRV